MGGIEALVRAIAAPIEDRIRCGFCVRSVRREGDRFLVSDGEATVAADRCISTIPLQALVPALEDVPPEVTDAVGRLVYNGVACVFVGLRGPVPPYSWVYIPEPELGFANRVSFPSNYSTGTAPQGCGSILAECTFRPGDPVATMGDSALVDHVLDRLEAMGVLCRDDVVFTGIARQPFAYVVYDLDYPGIDRDCQGVRRRPRDRPRRPFCRVRIPEHGRVHPACARLRPGARAVRVSFYVEDQFFFRYIGCATAARTLYRALGGVDGLELSWKRGTADADLVHYHTFGPLALHNRRRSHGVAVLSAHSTPRINQGNIAFARRINRLYPRIYAGFDHIVTISEPCHREVAAMVPDTPITHDPERRRP